MDRRRSRSRSRSRSPPGADYRRDDRYSRDRPDLRVGRGDYEYDRRGGEYYGDISSVPPPRRGNPDREQLERERRERMARMRADNVAEERGIDVEGEKSASVESAARPAKELRKSAGAAADDSDDDEVDEEQQRMMAMMGIGGFGTTKGKAVSDNQLSASSGAAQKNKARKYRQYMNRKGGFNRPLDKMN